MGFKGVMRGQTASPNPGWSVTPPHLPETVVMESHEQYYTYKKGASPRAPPRKQGPLRTRRSGRKTGILKIYIVYISF